MKLKNALRCAPSPIQFVFALADHQTSHVLPHPHVSRVVRSSDADDVTVVAAGITLHEAIAAADELAKGNIAVRVIDLYSVKPVDVETLRAAAAATDAIVTVEDHWPEGGIGDAVVEALADAENRPRVHKLAVRNMPGSGTPRELLHVAKIDNAAIVEAAVRSLVRVHD